MASGFRCETQQRVTNEEMKTDAGIVFKQIRVYKAGAENTGLIVSMKAAFADIMTSRHVIWHLFKRDFIAGFRQKLLGFLWIILAPLFGIASFIFMNVTGILNPGKMDIPYPLYVFFGTTMWGLLSGTISAVSSGLLGNADLIMRTNIPRIVFAVSGLAGVVYGIVVNLFVLMLLLLITGIVPSWGAVFYLVCMMPILFFGVGVGLILAVIGAVARDITGFVLSLLGFAMYLTPVVHTARFENPILSFITKYNPMTYLVDVPRTLFFTGNATYYEAYFFSVIMSICVLLLGVYGFYLIKDKVAERL